MFLCREMLFELVVATKFLITRFAKMFGPIFHFFLFVFLVGQTIISLKYVDFSQINATFWVWKHVLVHFEDFFNVFKTLIFGLNFILFFVIEAYFVEQLWFLAKNGRNAFSQPLHLIFGISYCCHIQALDAFVQNLLSFLSQILQIDFWTLTFAFLIHSVEFLIPYGLKYTFFKIQVSLFLQFVENFKTLIKSIFGINHFFNSISDPVLYNIFIGLYLDQNRQKSKFIRAICVA